MCERHRASNGKMRVIWLLMQVNFNSFIHVHTMYIFVTQGMAQMRVQRDRATFRMWTTRRPVLTDVRYEPVPPCFVGHKRRMVLPMARPQIVKSADRTRTRWFLQSSSSSVRPTAPGFGRFGILAVDYSRQPPLYMIWCASTVVIFRPDLGSQFCHYASASARECGYQEQPCYFAKRKKQNRLAEER